MCDPPTTIALPFGSIVTLWNERASFMSGTSVHTGEPLVMSNTLAIRCDGLPCWLSMKTPPPVMRYLPGANDVQAPNGTCVVPT